MERAISAFLRQSTKLLKLMAQPHFTLMALEKLDKLKKIAKNGKIYACPGPGPVADLGGAREGGAMPPQKFFLSFKK